MSWGLTIAYVADINVCTPLAHTGQSHDGGKVCRVAGQHPRLRRRSMRPQVTPLSPLPIHFITFLAAQRSNQGLVNHLAG
jgi:hypothetical protein